MLCHVKQLSAIYFPFREGITFKTAEKAIAFLEGAFKEKKVIKK